MSASTVTSKGQITLPVQVRRSLGLKTGSRVNFVPMDNGSYELVPATGTVKSLKGFIAAPATPVAVEQMDAAIADAVLGRQSR